MSRIGSLLRNAAVGLRSVFRRERLNEELDEELSAYLEMAAEEKMQQRVSRAEAVRLVRLEQGTLELTREVIHSATWESLVETCLRDIRFGLRILRKSPGFTATAILTLALGIGASTAIFTIIDSVLFRPLPVPNGDQLTVLASCQGDGPLQTQFSMPDLNDLSAETTNAFSGLLGYMPAYDGLSLSGKAGRILTNYVTGDYFALLGIQPYLGRFIVPSEGVTPGADPILVVSYSYWKSRFGSDTGIVGKQVLINGHTSTIIGVAPPGFYGVYPFANVEGYLPFSMVTTYEAGWPNDLMVSRGLQNLHVLARRRPGISLPAASASLAVVASRLASAYPATNRGMSLFVYPERNARPDPETSGTVKKAAGLFVVLIVLVVILACANLANLLLVRATVREREIVLRAALGARPSRLIRQLLTESIVVALLGGVVGLVLGLWTCHAIADLNLHTATPFHISLEFNWQVFSFAFVCALATGIVAGFVPALRASRAEVDSTLKASGRTVSGGKNRSRTALVALQVSGSLMLLIIAGLFAKSLIAVQHTNLGFDPDNIINITMDPSEVGYDETRGLSFYNSLLEQVRARADVQSAAVTSSTPLSNYFTNDYIRVPGYHNPPGRSLPLVRYSVISPGYFETLRILIIHGRDFTDRDINGAPNVAIVSEAFAQLFWPGQNALGKRFAKVSGITNPDYEVVGVAENSRFSSLTGPIGPYFYLPIKQAYLLSSLQVLQIRTSKPEAVMRETQDIARNLVPDLPLFNQQSLIESLDTLSGFLMFRLGAGLAAALGFLGLMLALIGVYGVVAYSVSQSTRDFAIRQALGAQRAQILRLVLSQGVVIVALGLMFGYISAFTSARTISDLLVGVSPADPATYIAVGVLVTSVVLVACCVLAWRAVKVDPMVILRQE